MYENMSQRMGEENGNIMLQDSYTRTLLEPQNITKNKAKQNNTKQKRSTTSKRIVEIK